MGFECCHPAVNLIYFAAVLAGTAAFQHPAFLTVSFLCAFAYSIKRNGRRALVFDLCLLPLIGVFALYYSSYTHFGMTVLRQNMVGNNMTLESLVYGIVLGVAGAGACIWFSCVFSVFTTDKVVYLFGKVSPGLSLFLAILLRMIPRIKKEAERINMAQQGIGRGANQGNLRQRVRNSLRIFSILITWTADSLTAVSESMGSRGSSLRGRRAYSVYRFDNQDRMYVIGMFLCLTLTAMAVLLGQTDMAYDPRIRWTKANPLFCIGYAVLCLMPLALELWTEYRFRKAREQIQGSCRPHITYSNYQSD